MRKKENNNIVVHKIHNEFTSNDCVQIMLTYDNNMTIIGDNGIMFHATDLNDIDVNNYITDERRKNFPFNDVPTHFEKEYFKKRFFVNQLFNYNQPYVIVHDGIPEKIFISKIENEAFFIQNIPQVNEPEVIVQSDVTETLQQIATKHSFIIDDDGVLLDVWANKEDREKNRIKFITYLEKNNIDYEIKNNGSIYYLPIRVSAIPNTYVSSNGKKCIITPNNNDFDIKVAVTKRIDDDMTSAKVYNLTYSIQNDIQRLHELKSQIKYLKAPKVKKKLLKK